MTTVRAKPYKAVRKNGYYIVEDVRTGEIASFPSTRSAASANAAILNRAYAEALADPLMAERMRRAG